MERVAFLIEDSGERLGCLLNPESLTMQRTAGVRLRRLAGGQLTSPGQTDDALLYTGGGRTELSLDLLFDVALAGSTIQTEDVKDLTGPLWRLAENAPQRNAPERRRPPLVRFVWGKAWNVPGIVTAVAERLERFSATGAPRRSWFSMRLVRADEPTARRTVTAAPSPSPADLTREGMEVPAERLDVHQAVGGSGPGQSSERLDEVAQRQYGDPAYWRLLASFNDLADPTRVEPGTLLQVPPASAVGGE